MRLSSILNSAVIELYRDDVKYVTEKVKGLATSQGFVNIDENDQFYHSVNGTTCQMTLDRLYGYCLDSNIPVVPRMGATKSCAPAMW
jgi:hypothetical protein